MASVLTADAPAEIRIFPDADGAARAAAAHIESLIAARTSSGEDFSLALSGGNTPRPLYRRLAADYRDRIPWARVNIFWSDERYVPHDDPRSNYRMARETLLDHVPVSPGHVYPMPTEPANPDEAAWRYERTLRANFSGARSSFDLILLGIGSDGHTASLFPNSPALDETQRCVVVAAAPVEPKVRLTFTLPALNRADTVFFVVTGADKAPALRRIVKDSPDPHLCPAAGVRPPRGTVIWWVDAAAASTL